MSRPISHYSRVHYRIPIHYPAMMVHGGHSTVVLVTDLSVQGCAVEYEQSVLLGPDIELRMEWLTTPTSAITATVRWQHGRRCGLEFVGMPNEIYEQLRGIMIDHLGKTLHSADGTA
jgi:hypothetical protein